MTDNAIFEGACTQQNRRAGEFALFTRRISSLNPRDCWLVFGSLAVVSTLIATVFAVLGAWLILPFAGVEVLALGLALRWVMRHAKDSETLVVCGDTVTLALRECDRTQQYAFNRAWARVVVDRQARRVALRSHGREIEIGRYLDADGKRALAREMRARLAVKRI